LAWLKPGAVARFDAIPTEFGPVTLLTKVSRDGKTLAVTYRPKFRHPPSKVWLHIPPVAGLRTVLVNGRRVPMKTSQL